MTDFLHQPDETIRLGEFLKTQLQNTEWTSFRAAIAFVKNTGVRHIFDELVNFARRANVRISVGVDQNGTSYDGLKRLLEAVGANGEIWVFHNENQSTFHPKVYVFSNDEWADVVVGSGNLTEGGLFTNYEASLATRLHLTANEDRVLFDQIQAVLDAWSDPTSSTVNLLTGEFLEQLLSSGYVATESQMQSARLQRIVESQEAAEESEKDATQHPLFYRVPVRRAPRAPRPPTEPDLPVEISEDEFTVEPPLPVEPQAGAYLGFVMTLQRTDVGVGQTTAGTSRRSPEIFIPLSARNFDPDFWGWPDLFAEDNRRPGKSDRMGVRVRLGTQIVNVNMMIWPVKHDFRLRSEALRSAGNVNDILRIERADGSQGYSYYVTVIPFGTSEYQHYLDLCVNETQNSHKLWGYY